MLKEPVAASWSIRELTLVEKQKFKNIAFHFFCNSEHSSKYDFSGLVVSLFLYDKFN